MRDIIADLKYDLAVNPDHIYIGSGLGGNASEFYFLLSRDIELVKVENLFSKKDNSLIISDPYFYYKNNNPQMLCLACKDDVKMLEIRKALTNFCANHTNDVQEITFEYILDSLKENEKTKDLIDLFECSKLTQKLIVFLNERTCENRFWTLTLDSTLNELNIISLINNFPDYIKIFTIRIVIGFNNFIKFNLDEKITIFNYELEK